LIRFNKDLIRKQAYKNHQFFVLEYFLFLFAMIIEVLFLNSNTPKSSQNHTPRFTWIKNKTKKNRKGKRKMGNGQMHNVH